MTGTKPLVRLTKQYTYVNAIKDRYGNKRYYYRRDYQSIRIHSDFGTPAFDHEYHDIHDAWVSRTPASLARIISGSVNDLVMQYYASADFKTLTSTTQKNYRRIFDDFRGRFGDKMVRGMQRRHVLMLKDSMASTPGASRTYLKRLNTLFNFAVQRDFRTDSPMTGVKLPSEGDGFLPWSDEDIDLYLKKWVEGTKERLALYACLYTAQRRSDIVNMGDQHVREDEISVIQQKTGKRLWMPLHPILKAELKLRPKGQIMWFVNDKTGNPIPSESFGNFVRAAAKAAGIDGTRGPHGLRKAACRRLIEAGCDATLARSISGHASEKELLVYIQDVNQQKLARVAIAKLK
ncbi:MAG: tyrosine-type recombinase/integrase [Asticcacaulis sp.]